MVVAKSFDRIGCEANDAAMVLVTYTTMVEVWLTYYMDTFYLIN